MKKELERIQKTIDKLIWRKQQFNNNSPIDKKRAMARIDYYKIIDLNEDATEEVIKKLQRRLAFHYPPDHNHNDFDAGEKLKEMSDAYSILRDTEKRELYDKIEYNNFLEPP